MVSLIDALHVQIFAMSWILVNGHIPNKELGFFYKNYYFIFFVHNDTQEIRQAKNIL